MPETTRPIDKSNVYKDTESDYVNFVTIDGFYIDEDGNTQIKVSQYTNKPIAAHNSCSYLSNVPGRLTLSKSDVRDRILNDELIFDEKL